jgi:hypothetical protein
MPLQREGALSERAVWTQHIAIVHLAINPGPLSAPARGWSADMGYFYGAEISFLESFYGFRGGPEAAKKTKIMGQKEATN